MQPLYNSFSVNMYCKYKIFLTTSVFVLFLAATTWNLMKKATKGYMSHITDFLRGFQ